MTLKAPEGRFAYIAPLYTQAKDVAWVYLKRYAEPITAKVNESELWVELINGSRIRLYGADNPDRLRGLYLDGLVLDEYADMAPSVWGEALRPAISDRMGWATFIGTPKGRNEFWKKYADAEGQPDWLRLMLRASETGILPASELEAAARDMTPEQFAQEFECSFDAAILGAYYGKEIADAERMGRIGAVEPDLSLPVHTAWDLGIGDSTAIWLFQAVAGEVRVLDWYENHGQPLAHYVAELDARGKALGISWGVDYVPHDARVRSLQTGRTRVETLDALGRKPQLVPAHKVEDGINAGRLMLPRMWFNADRCGQGIEALRQYRTEYDEKSRAFKNTPKHDWTSHTADAFRYMAIAVREKMQPVDERPKTEIRGLNQITVKEFIDFETGGFAHEQRV